MNLFVYKLNLLAALIFSGNIIAQTGAAGVGSAGTLPMWFDANALTLTNGSQVAQFTDISGNSNHLTQTSSIKRPIYTTGALNGLPVVDFDGVNDFLTRGATPALETTNITYFIVYQRVPVDDQSLINAGYTSELSKWGTYSLPTTNKLISIQRSPGAKTIFFNDFGSPSFLSTHITPTNFSTYNQGTLMQSMNTSYTAGIGHNLIRVGAYNYNLTHYLLNGYIAEMIIYNTALNNLERILVENYLGAKYGMAVPTDLYAYEATNNIGLIGVGNNGVNSQSSAKGAGVLEISSPASMTSNEYLLTAHTNDALSLFTFSDLPGSLPGQQRWTRTWRVDETGEVGNIDVKFYLSGGNNFGSSTSYVLLVDNVTQDGDFTDATQVTGVYDGGTQTITFNTNLNDADFFTLSALDQQLEIHAINTGVWSDPNTWDCGCIPSANDDVYIDANVNVTVDVNAETEYFSIGDPGGMLTMNSDFTLSIYGDWDLLGSVNLTDGKIEMVGAIDQYIDAGGTTVNFNDFEVNNSGGGTVTLYESTYILNGTLYPTMGSLTINPTPANIFIINSTSATTTARIAPVGTSFTFNGTYTVRRFLPAGVADYRDIASPLNGAQLYMWDNSISISGVGFPDGCAFGGGGCFYSVQYYTSNNAVDVTDILAPLVVGRGYEVFVGDDLNTFSGATLEVTGTLNDGQDQILTASANYSTRGNPYASPIDWDNIGRSGVGNYFYVYDNATGFYEYYDGSDQSSSIPDLSTGVIDMGQAFWVVGPGTLTISDASKTTSGMFIRETVVDKSMTLRLKENSSTYSSSVAFQQSSESSDNLDFLVDVPHLTTDQVKAPSFAMYSADEELIRKNYIRDDFRNKSFELYTKILNAGYYTIEASNIENFNNYLKVLLYDNETGLFINLKKETSYTFYSNVTEGHRFTLIFSNQVGEEEESIQSLIINDEVENGLTITQMGHTFNIVSSTDFTEDSEIKLVNVLGQQEVFYQSIKFVNGSNMVTIPDEYKGVHILVITTGDKIVTKKVVL